MEMQYEINIKYSKTLRVKVFSGTNLFVTNWYWVIYIIEGFINTLRYFAKAYDVSFIPEVIRANIFIHCEETNAVLVWSNLKKNTSLK